MDINRIKSVYNIIMDFQELTPYYKVQVGEDLHIKNLTQNMLDTDLCEVILLHVIMNKKFFEFTQLIAFYWSEQGGLNPWSQCT